MREQDEGEMRELWNDPDFSNRRFSIDNRYTSGGCGWLGESRIPHQRHGAGQAKPGRVRRQCVSRSRAGAQSGWQPDPNKQREQAAKAVAVEDIDRLRQRFNTR